MTEKARVNGRNAHPIFQALTSTESVNGLSGRVTWNFEKFLLGPNGTLTRFRPATAPEDPEVIHAIEAALSAAGR